MPILPVFAFALGSWIFVFGVGRGVVRNRGGIGIVVEMLIGILLLAGSIAYITVWHR